jgi:DUF1009 family protein
MGDAKPMGLIAGGGRLPLLEVEGLKAAGRPVVCVGLDGCFDAALPGMCDRFATAGVVRLGRWIGLLKRWGADEAIMVGKVNKGRMYDPLRFIRQLPDWRAARLWFRELRHDKRTPAMLGALTRELARSGVHLIDTTRYIPDHLAGEGVLTKRQPTAAQLADAHFGFAILQKMLTLGVGQALTVRDREVIAVEAMEGTDGLIQRTGQLCRGGGWTLIKAAGPDKDPRWDVPTIGQGTIAKLRDSGGGCLAVEAGRVILVDQPLVLADAEAAKVAVVGLRGPAAMSSACG